MIPDEMPKALKEAVKSYGGEWLDWTKTYDGHWKASFNINHLDPTDSNSVYVALISPRGNMTVTRPRTDGFFETPKDTLARIKRYRHEDSAG